MPPAIEDMEPGEGPPGTVITVTGTNFSPTQGVSTISFHGVKATPTSWTSTAIVVPVPVEATSGEVVVKVNGVESHSGSLFDVTSAESPGATTAP